jgi:hypothetical protein
MRARCIKTYFCKNNYLKIESTCIYIEIRIVRKFFQVFPNTKVFSFPKIPKLPIFGHYRKFIYGNPKIFS